MATRGRPRGRPTSASSSRALVLPLTIRQTFPAPVPCRLGEFSGPYGRADDRHELRLNPETMLLLDEGDQLLVGDDAPMRASKLHALRVAEWAAAKAAGDKLANESEV